MKFWNVSVSPPSIPFSSTEDKHPATGSPCSPSSSTTRRAGNYPSAFFVMHSVTSSDFQRPLPPTPRRLPSLSSFRGTLPPRSPTFSPLPVALIPYFGPPLLLFPHYLGFHGGLSGCRKLRRSPTRPPGAISLSPRISGFRSHFIYLLL